MRRDPGLAADPWVSIQLRHDSVLVDGVDVGGPADDRYARALRQVAAEVAAPLGRQVGATVVDRRGGTTHLAVHPDGSTDDIAALVAAASAAPAPAVRLRAERPVVSVAGKRRGPWSRRLVWGLASALAAGLTAGGVAALASVAIDSRQQPNPRPMAQTSPAGTGSASPSAPAATRAPLDAEVVAAGPGRVRILLSALPRQGRVTVTLDPARGDRVVRRLLVGPGRDRLLLTGLTGGRTAWRLSFPGTSSVAGTVRVAATPAPDPAPVLPTTSSAPQPTAPSPTGGGGGGGGGGNNNPNPPQVTPIDPDDQ